MEANGRTTIHILKTEMGQHIGTTLAQVVAEELELPDELSFLAQEIKNRLKQQQYKIILDIFFIMLPPILSD